MNEVIYPTPENKKPNCDDKCPVCRGDMRHGIIPCPDGLSGCCVGHYGYTCLVCGRVFN